MSEPNRVLKILEDYTIGEAITSHNGVVCYPAMRNNTDDKYILKAISVPASNVKLAALLLSGAYASREDALAYYKELAQEILQENRIMNELSNLEGFQPYLSSQLTEKADGNGYEVWLLAHYQQSLAQIFSEQVMTHRGIMDLALDLSSALAACRRAGYLYIDLKPENIFYDPNQGYRIADLGFLSLNSIKYASLPEKYFSIYTAPEITDAESQLNDTLDVYALGLILYQAYNGGVLPMNHDQLDNPLLPPIYADYEMAQIILTACHPDPEKRWQDPTALGQAMVQYMQDFGTEDISIIPEPVNRPELDVGEDFLPEENAETEEWMQDPELAFMQELVSDETAPTVDNTADIQDSAISEETSQILAQADDLIAHTPPEPAVASNPVFASMPEPIATEGNRETPLSESDPSPDDPADEPEFHADPDEADPSQEDEVKQLPNPRRKLVTRLVTAAIILCFLIAAVILGVNYYQNIYLQSIDSILLDGTVDSITVKLDTQADEQLLLVTCSDTYGNTLTSPVTNGTAVFTGLSPQTRYTVRVSISGYHKLTGTVSDSFTTGKQTNVETFFASIGPEDGSVYLNFSVSGAECNTWLLSYSAPGIPGESISFTGHSVTIFDLTIGADYSFMLSSEESKVVGQNAVSYTARAITRAQNPVITACGNGLLTVQWESPTDETVEMWTVRCSDASGYDQTVVTDQLTFTFSELAHETTCTVEITAEGMPQGVVVSISADPVTVTQFHYASDDLGNLIVTWEYSGGAPEGGWVINWTCDNAPEHTTASETNSIAVPYVPGVTYSFNLTPADGKAFFGEPFTLTTEESQSYSGHGITAENLQFAMCIMPDEEDWLLNQMPEEAFKTEFTPEEIAALIIRCDIEPELVEDTTLVTFILRDSEGLLLDVSTRQSIWSAMWNEGVCAWIIPTMPDEPGGYCLSIYFDGMLLTMQDFVIL